MFYVQRCFYTAQEEKKFWLDTLNCIWPNHDYKFSWKWVFSLLTLYNIFYFLYIVSKRCAITKCDQHLRSNKECWKFFFRLFLPFIHSSFHCWMGRIRERSCGIMGKSAQLWREMRWSLSLPFNFLTIYSIHSG